jgi:hypothetical protein
LLCWQNSSHQHPLEGAVCELQLPAQEALQSALKLLQQSFSPAHHESQKQPLGACEKQIPEHSPAAAGRTRARAKRATRVIVIAPPRCSADNEFNHR